MEPESGPVFGNPAWGCDSWSAALPEPAAKRTAATTTAELVLNSSGITF